MWRYEIPHDLRGRVRNLSVARPLALNIKMTNGNVHGLTEILDLYLPVGSEELHEKPPS
jgi:hypothetical protein